MASITLSITAAATTLSVFSYLAVQRELRDTVESRALRDSEVIVSQLAPARLTHPSTEADLESSGLIADLNRTTAGFSIRFPDDSEAASGFAFAPDPSPRVQALVDSGRFALQWVELSDERTYVLVAAGQQPSGPDFFLYYEAEPTLDTLATLARSLVVGSLAVVLAGLAAAGLASRRMLRPVQRVSDAAQQVATGDLDLVVPVESDDEIGHLARSFNHMTRALATKVAELEQAEADQRSFVADVSHELRTPLTALVHEADLLSDAIDPNSPASVRLAELLVADVGRLRRLVEDLLEISRLDADVDAVEQQPIDLGEFLQAVIDHRLPSASLNLDASNLRVFTDRRRLERIVGNLLDNALVHGNGSDVRVAVSVRADDGPDSRTIVVTVTDRGPGFRPGTEDRIFDRFAKGDTARHEGTNGLGLAIALAHARRLGGDLRARSTSEGAAFDLVFPFTPVTELLPDGDGKVTPVAEDHP